MTTPSDPRPLQSSCAAELQEVAQTLRVALASRLPDLSVEVVADIDSTNTELMRRAREGWDRPVLLVAQAQHSGRGRLGRAWEGQRQGATGPLSSLTFSLGLPLSLKDWSGLSLAVGLSVATSLHPDLRIKWPNDLWWQDRKLAGILIETASVGASRYAVIGIGVNITPRDPTGLSTPPACLQELLPDISAAKALLRMAEPLVAAVQRFEQQGFAPFQTAFVARDALLGRVVQLSDGASGVAQGVDASGALLLHTAQGVQKITTAEVSVRPVA